MDKHIELYFVCTTGIHTEVSLIHIDKLTQLNT